MLLVGHKTAETYGKVISQDESTGEIPPDDLVMDDGEGLIVLDVQYRILQFLNRCAEDILHDQVLDNLSEPLPLGALTIACQQSQSGMPSPRLPPWSLPTAFQPRLI